MVTPSPPRIETALRSDLRLQPSDGRIEQLASVLADRLPGTAPGE